MLNAHEHNYLGYAQQDPAGRATLDGIRRFVVDTDGKIHHGLLDEKDPNYEVGNDSDFGVLRLDLGEDSYPTSERTPTHGSS